MSPLQEPDPGWGPILAFWAIMATVIALGVLATVGR